MENEEEFEEYDSSLDESQSEYEQRKRQEAREQRDREALAGPKCAAVYQRLIRESRLLTDGEFRLLCALTSFGARLENSFPGLRAIQQRLGGPLRSVQQISQLRTSCIKKGFLHRVPLGQDEHGCLIELEADGRFASEVGNQFLLPEGIVGETWAGPRVWTNRIYLKRRR